MALLRTAGLAASILLALSSCGPSPAQDVTGDWQGTLGAPPEASRLVLKVADAGGGQLTVHQINIDQSGFDAPFGADTARFAEGELQAVFTGLRLVIAARLSPRGDSLVGSWTQDGRGQALALARATNATAWRDSSPHTTRFIAVAPNVKLEVLDWGGRGRAVVLIPGAGMSAHSFDDFARTLSAHYRVYGITRRGFGFSSRPPTGYSADRLADDVLAVVDTLGLEKPVMMGHSMGGAELSSIGTRRADRVGGLVYLDGGYNYAFHDPTQEDALLHLSEVRRRIDELSPTLSPRDLGAIIDSMLATLPLLERDLRTWSQRLASRPDRLVTPPFFPRDWTADSLMNGRRKFTRISGPVLAIFAAREAIPPEVAVFRRGVPQARVVVIPGADHFVFRSHEAEVLREVRPFIDGLKRIQ